MPGPPPKDESRRQRTNTRPAAVVPFRRAIAVRVPAMPPGLLAVTQTYWKQFWTSPLATAVEPDSDTPAIVRLFTLHDERERAYRAYRKERLVQGSQGQRVLNPMGRAMHEFDAEIRQMEDRLGLTPRARLQLGLTMGEAAKSLAELNRLLDEDEETDEADPRQ